MYRQVQLVTQNRSYISMVPRTILHDAFLAQAAFHYWSFCNKDIPYMFMFAHMRGALPIRSIVQIEFRLTVGGFICIPCNSSQLFDS